MPTSTFNADPAIFELYGATRVKIREGMQQTGTADSCQIVGVQTEEINTGLTVVGDVRSNVNFGDIDTETTRQSPGSNIDIQERNDRNPGRTVVFLNSERRWYPTGEILARNGPVDEEELAPTERERDDHVGASLSRRLGSSVNSRLPTWVGYHDRSTKPNETIRRIISCLGWSYTPTESLEIDCLTVRLSSSQNKVRKSLFRSVCEL